MVIPSCMSNKVFNFKIFISAKVDLSFKNFSIRELINFFFQNNGQIILHQKNYNVIYFMKPLINYLKNNETFLRTTFYIF